MTAGPITDYMNKLAMHGNKRRHGMNDNQVAEMPQSVALRIEHFPDILVGGDARKECESLSAETKKKSCYEQVHSRRMGVNRRRPESSGRSGSGGGNIGLRARGININGQEEHAQIQYGTAVCA